SECLLFGSLISTYLVYKGKSVVGPYPPEILNIPFTSVSTFDLLMSSLMMVLALAAVQRGDLKWGKIWLFSTALLGLVFLGGQVLEFTEFVHKGLTIGTNLFGCTFFVLTGTHGAHVTVGVLWLLTLWVRALQGKLGRANAMTVEITGLYWHFVDVVWIVIFTVVYLIQCARNPERPRGARTRRRRGMSMPAPGQRWDWHASVVIGLALLGGRYAYLGGLAAPRRRVLALGAALGVLCVALNGPLHNLSDGYLFSAHMVQHLLLTLVFPPLLLYGAPVWVVRP